MLVTGGPGYLAGFTICALLEQGYNVRTTLRSLSKEASVRAAIAAGSTRAADLKFFVADLNSDAGWAEAVAGCDFVLHLASPMGVNSSKGLDLIPPTRDGMMRVVKASVAARVQRIVITSSTVAAIPPAPQPVGVLADESVWTDPVDKSTTNYARAKTLGERAAWAYVAEHGGAAQLTTILPGFIVGPMLGNQVAPSVEIIARMFNGKVPRAPHIGFATVDVRDVVDLHLRAMRSPAAQGQRFIAAGEFLWLSDMAKILRAHFGERAAKVPTKLLPDWVLHALALFSTEARLAAAMLGRRNELTSAKAERLLDWQRRPAAESVIAAGQSVLAQHGG